MKVVTKEKIILSLSFSIVVISLFLSTANYGVGITPDSVHYFSGAENILTLKKYHSAITNWDCSSETSPIYAWPPGYSVFLSFILTVSSSFFSFIIIVNASLLLISIYLVHKILIIINNTHYISLIFIFSCAGSYYTFFYLWSETLFLPVTLYFLYCYLLFIQNRTIGLFLRLCFILSLLIFIKLVGFFWLFSFVLILFLETKNRYFVLNNAKICFAGLFLSVLPIGTFLLRNLLLMDFWLGRNDYGQSIFEKLKQISISLVKLFFPQNSPFIITVIIAALFLIYIATNLDSKEKIILFIFAISNIIFLTIIGSITDIGNIDFRLLSPSIILLLILFISSFNFKKTIVLLIIIIFLIINTLRLNLWSIDNYIKGIGEFSQQFYSSETLKSLIIDKKNVIVYSNRPEMINLKFTTPVKFLPFNENEIRQFLLKISNEKFYLVFFYEPQYSDQISYEYWNSIFNNFNRKVYPDGEIISN